MNAPALPSREHDGVDALVTDRYLETLLAAADRQADDTPADAGLDPDLRHAARVLRRSMLRIHPSFRFEERLAERLAGMAAQSRPMAATGGRSGTVVVFPDARRAGGSPGGSHGAPHGAPPDPLLDAILRGDLDPSDAAAMERAARPSLARRPLIVGGAITSAAISIIGVAWVAWRAAHPAEGAMTRAARTAHARRGPATVLPGGGLGGPA